MKKEVNKKTKIIIGVGCLLVVIIVIVVLFATQGTKESYAANSLYDAIDSDAQSGYGSYYTDTTSDCWSADNEPISELDTACASNTTSLYCAVRNDANDGHGDIYRKGTGDCYSVDTPNSVVTSTTYNATFYYQASSTSGTTSISSATAECETSSDSCSVTIPTAVRNSVGTYNNAYAGLATSTSTMSASVNSSATTVTLTGDTTYYAIYRSNITNYYYN